MKLENNILLTSHTMVSALKEVPISQKICKYIENLLLI